MYQAARFSLFCASCKPRVGTEGNLLARGVTNENSGAGEPRRASGLVDRAAVDPGQRASRAEEALQSRAERAHRGGRAYLSARRGAEQTARGPGQTPCESASDRLPPGPRASEMAPVIEI
ncbi:hypothetical protein HPB48_015466 [Haemaphysalis longicornis]|uniref:Uncharacterized protein n=1 Tax=Haemaphysalis longicornis TaxID=44386 RepID=A0A9J6FKV2_HAELO|nr:hypothetical protein HPB48_015466 [Haemaphysalis longicornis]